MGRLMVDNYLQVKGLTDVYAIGDCCDTPEIKVATGAQAHAKYVVENIKLKGEGKEPKPYKVNGMSRRNSLFIYGHSVNFWQPRQRKSAL